MFEDSVIWLCVIVFVNKYAVKRPTTWTDNAALSTTNAVCHFIIISQQGKAQIVLPGIRDMSKAAPKKER
jgi:hypothetical protein